MNSCSYHSQAYIVCSGFNGAFTVPGTYEYPEDYTNVTFANGTTVPVENVAFVNAETWSVDIINGTAFTEYFCIAPAQPSTTSSSSNATATLLSIPSATIPTGTTAPTLLGYPYGAVAKDPNNQIAGYFLNGTGLDDIALLRIASFANETVAVPSDAATSFVNTAIDFFAAVAAANKTKLIIDVSGNGGGNTILPNDVVSALPRRDPLVSTDNGNSSSVSSLISSPTVPRDFAATTPPTSTARLLQLFPTVIWQSCRAIMRLSLDTKLASTPHHGTTAALSPPTFRISLAGRVAKPLTILLT